MKKETKTFLWKLIDISVLFFLLDLIFELTVRPFPLFPKPEFFGTIFLYVVVGSIIASIPFAINFKRSKLMEETRCQEHQ